MRRSSCAAAAVLTLLAAACTGQDAVLVGNSINAAGAAVNPPIMRAVDGIEGWKRTGPPDRYTKDGLYGYIDGGAEIVLSYGFRELSVFRFRPAADPASSKEIVLEVYRMKSGRSAFGLYSTKLEGDEKGWPKIKSDNWISPGQANLVKGDYLINVLAPECTDQEIGPFMAAVDKKSRDTGPTGPRGWNGCRSKGRSPRADATSKARSRPGTNRPSSKATSGASADRKPGRAPPKPSRRNTGPRRPSRSSSSSSWGRTSTPGPSTPG